MFVSFAACFCCASIVRGEGGIRGWGGGGGIGVGVGDEGVEGWANAPLVWEMRNKNVWLESICTSVESVLKATDRLCFRWMQSSAIFVHNDILAYLGLKFYIHPFNVDVIIIITWLCGFWREITSVLP